MTETQKTGAFLLAGVLLVLLAFVTAPVRVTPDDFLDRGESFFPGFTDPNIASSLEVIEFDEDTAAARPFKVMSQDGKWTIPSHHDYPADGKERLSQTAAAMIQAAKEDFRTSNVSEHESLGVLDPLDEKLTTLKGRGRRITIRGEAAELLADLIVGNPLEGRDGYYFVRVPDQKRVYVANLKADFSTRFEDWIEKDLLEISQGSIDRAVLSDYSVDERTGSINQREVTVLEKEGGEWKADRMSSSEEVDSSKMTALLGAIDGLSIVGVRPKPDGLSQTLRREEGAQISQADVVSLQSRGYYFSRDGRLLSNEGELEVRLDDGVQYTLRFGEVLYGTGDSITAGTEPSKGEEKGPGENRYLFITSSFDSKSLSEPPKPGNTNFQEKPEEDWSDGDRKNQELQQAHDQWSEQVMKAVERSERLNVRFAEWYYVISSKSFDEVHLGRSDLIKKKE